MSTATPACLVDATTALIRCMGPAPTSRIGPSTARPRMYRSAHNDGSTFAMSRALSPGASSRYDGVIGVVGGFVGRRGGSTAPGGEGRRGARPPERRSARVRRRGRPGRIALLVYLTSG